MFCRAVGSATQVPEALAFPIAPWNFVWAVEMHGGANVGSPVFVAFEWHLSSALASLLAAFNAPAGHVPVPGIAAPTFSSQASALFSHTVISPEQGPRDSALAKAEPNLSFTLASHGAWNAGSFLAATLARQLSSPPSFLLIAFSFPLRHFGMSCPPAVPTSKTAQARPPSATPIRFLDIRHDPPWSIGDRPSTLTPSGHLKSTWRHFPYGPFAKVTDARSRLFHLPTHRCRVKRLFFVRFEREGREISLRGDGSRPTTAHQGGAKAPLQRSWRFPHRPGLRGRRRTRQVVAGSPR